MTLTGLVSATVAALALTYAVAESRRLRSGRRFRLVGRAQSVRRIFGALAVVGLMALVYSGLELVDPHLALGRYLLIWGIASLLVVLLVALGILDWKELSAHRDIERARHILAFGREMRSAGCEPERGEGRNARPPA